jgi:hypothetical protein
MRYRVLFMISLVIVTACGRRTQDPNILIDQAVAATLAARPEPTSVSVPFPTAYPTPTPFDLNGLFCEYQFCIGHPVDMAFYDVSAVTSNQGTPSNYQTGLIAAYSGGLVLQFMWQFSPGTTDPGFLLDLIIEDGLDTTSGAPEVKRIREMNVMYSPITTTATPVLPFGGAAAWTCGERVFAWKAYTADQASAAGLFESALARFDCNQ